MEESMEPITATAIAAALAAGLVRSAGTIGEKVIEDGYEALKNLLKRKLGEGSAVVKAVDDLEMKPESDGRKQTLQEEVKEARIDDDPQIRDAALDLLARIKSQPGGERHVQQASAATSLKPAPMAQLR
jgi:hypothetical protein